MTYFLLKQEEISEKGFLNFKIFKVHSEILAKDREQVISEWKRSVKHLLIDKFRINMD